MMKIVMHDKNAHLNYAEHTKEEQAEIYDLQLQDILDHTREYLDNVERMRTYKVFWVNYRSKMPTIPYKFVKKRNLYKETATSIN